MRSIPILFKCHFYLNLYWSSSLYAAVSVDGLLLFGDPLRNPHYTHSSQSNGPRISKGTTSEKPNESHAVQSTHTVRVPTGDAAYSTYTANVRIATWRHFILRQLSLNRRKTKASKGTEQRRKQDKQKSPARHCVYVVLVRAVQFMLNECKCIDFVAGPYSYK